MRREIPGTKTVLLDTNYRSQANIVEDALNLIGHNKERFQKLHLRGTPGGDRGGVCRF